MARLSILLSLTCLACGRVGFDRVASTAFDGGSSGGDAMPSMTCGSLTEDTSCGNCGTRCTCSNGTCTGPYTCNPGYAHCTGPATGCETSLSSDATCGDCATTCATDQTCVNQACAACPQGFADCDGLASNGCETDILTDRNNCGGCGPNYACSGPTVCRDGQCY